MTVNNSTKTDESQSPDQTVEAEVLEKQVASPVETDKSTEGASGTEQPPKDSDTVEESFTGIDIESIKAAKQTS